MQTLITAAGESLKDFEQAGFTLPKSLIHVDGSPVIVRALNSYVYDSNFVTVAVNSSEASKFPIQQAIRECYPRAEIVQVPPKTKGALPSALVAWDKLDPSLPLLIAAGDSEIQVDIRTALDDFINQDSDGGTIVFRAQGGTWSYASVGHEGKVREVSEKHQVGQWATVGAFYFKKARDFLDASSWILMNNAHVNGNFYVSSTLNFLISRGKTVSFKEIKKAQYRRMASPSDFGIER